MVLSNRAPQSPRICSAHSPADAHGMLKMCHAAAGHALHNDWAVLRLSHPPELIRDTSAWGRERLGYRKLPSLKSLCKVHLQLEVQESMHSPVEDSRACMNL